MIEFQQRVAAYLYFGYLPDYENVNLTSVIHGETFAPESYTAREAARRLNRLADRIFEGLKPGGTCVVPLSGGLDSRVLLGLALDRLHVSQIKTVTFGRRGQLDYDLGKKIADDVGVESQLVDLQEKRLHWAELVESACKAPWTHFPDAFFNDLARSNAAASSDLILSGFLGEALTGGHVQWNAAVGEAALRFAQSQQCSQLAWKMDPHYDPAAELPPQPEGQGLASSAFYDLSIRQPCYIHPVVTGQTGPFSYSSSPSPCRASGAMSVTPFADHSWMRYWLQAPLKQLEGQRLYIDMMGFMFPSLAAMPTKETLGARPGHRVQYAIRFAMYGTQYLADRVLPRTPRFAAKLNYVNYSVMLRTRPDYKGIVEEASDVLREQAPTLGHILREKMALHRAGKQNHARDIMLLVGVAANLSAMSYGTGGA